MAEYLYSPVGRTANMCPYPYEEYCVNLDAYNAYCDYNNIGSRPHTLVRYGSPMDIITNWNESVHLYTSTGINSVSLVHYDNACAGSPDVGASKMVVMHMYTGANLGGSWVGSVVFAHVNNRKAQGTWNLTDSGLGYHYLYDIGNCAPTYGACSTACHVHVEQDNATTGSDIQCPDTAVAAASWLFRWGELMGHLRSCDRRLLLLPSGVLSVFIAFSFACGVGEETTATGSPSPMLPSPEATATAQPPTTAPPESKETFDCTRQPEACAAAGRWVAAA